MSFTDYILAQDSWFQKQPPEVFYEKKVFLEISQNSQKNTFVRVSFNKVAGLRPHACNFIKKESLAQVFSCEFCQIPKNTFFTDDFRTSASVVCDEENTLLLRTCNLLLYNITFYLGAIVVNFSSYKSKY